MRCTSDHLTRLLFFHGVRHAHDYTHAFHRKGTMCIRDSIVKVVNAVTVITLFMFCLFSVTESGHVRLSPASGPLSQVEFGVV